MSPFLRRKAPIPSSDDCAAYGEFRQGFPPAPAESACGLDRTRRKPETDFPQKRGWELMESAPGNVPRLQWPHAADGWTGRLRVRPAVRADDLYATPRPSGARVHARGLGTDLGNV